MTRTPWKQRTRHAVLGLAGASFALAGCAAPAFTFKAGQQLSPEQLRQVDATPAPHGGGKVRYKVLPQPTADGSTLVVNEQGMVMSSRHEVLVASASQEQVQAATARGPRPAAVQHYAPTGITVVRYADFAQALQGLDALKAALPQATVRLSLQGPRQEAQ